MSQAAALGQKLLFAGQGFEPDTYLDVESVWPDGTEDVFPGDNNSLLLTDSAGELEGFDVTFDRAEEVGDWTMTFSDGTCEASATFSVSE